MHAIDLPLSAIRKLLDGASVSSLDLAEACIARSQAYSDLNVWVSFDPEALRKEARDADSRLAAGERLPLLGIPIALKDNIEAAGMACGAGTASLNGKLPQADAELVARLRAAGAVIAGKVGMHELAFGITTNNAVTGAVRNPWDRTRIPGAAAEVRAPLSARASSPPPSERTPAVRSACRRPSAGSAASGRRSDACRHRASHQFRSLATLQGRWPTPLRTARFSMR